MRYYKPLNRLKILQLSLIGAWGLFIAVLLTMHADSLPNPTPNLPFEDKIVHFVLFGFLARLIAGWLARHSHLKIKYSALVSLVVSIFYAGIFEIVQSFLPYRSADWFDFLAGIFGVALALMVWYPWQLKHPRRQVKPRLLLHVCCGPCSADLIRELSKEFEIVLFFTNDNIDTAEEFTLRWQQVVKVAKYYNLPTIMDEYDHDKWLAIVHGLEHEPEQGARCPVCFKARLEIAASFAKEHDYDYFTTTLSVSPHKNFEQIKTVGDILAKKYGIKFLVRDFKKQDGYKKSTNKARELGLYRQEYCGCEFAKEHLNKQKKTV